MPRSCCQAGKGERRRDTRREKGEAKRPDLDLVQVGVKTNVSGTGKKRGQATSIVRIRGAVPLLLEAC